jgi:peptide/nickel transport system permease protein
MTIVGPDPLTAARPERPASATRRLRFIGPGFWQALWASRSGRFGLILVGITLLGALVSVLGLALHDPQAQSADVLKSPTLDHLAGTDQFGRDIFSLVLQGIVVSLEIAFIATLIAGGIGTLGGIVAGYLGGAASTVIMRSSDVIFAIPAILLALAIVTALGPGILDSALAIGVAYIPIFVRVVRAPVLSLRNADFVRAGQVLGFSRSRLLLRHILPSVYGAVAVQTSLALAWAILAEASLSFLGLGPPPPTASLGQMVADSSSLAGIAWWTLFAPSLAIVIAVVGFNFLGDGLRDAADPRSRRS